MTPCPVCGRAIAPDLLELTRNQTARPVQALIRQARPGWSPADGICPDCAQAFARQHAESRSGDSLHTSTFPHGTFPYYHPTEETVLAQPQRLADDWQASGRGVTIAFLDSGYYPHPDLLDRQQATVDPAGLHGDVGRLRRKLAGQPHRIRQYVNIQSGQARASVHAPSLWSDALNSWHGQMSAVLAAGSGFLSRGRFRGFAPEAGVVLTKIGRVNGRIPEEDILAGMAWLLADDNWARYGVRVLNVSIGGDAPQPWQENPVCLAVEELAQRGVLTVAAAGNAGQPLLLAPASAPSALTVGGTDDANRPAFISRPEATGNLSLYNHNWGIVDTPDGPIAKPELLAPAVWQAGPLLPVSPVFREAWAIGAVWQALADDEPEQARALLADWHELLEFTPSIARADVETIRRALRFRMNPLKWVHSFYQHVDGTSVAAPQVAAVAAQMLAVNSDLSPAQVKALLLESAVPLSGLPAERVGAGLLQPSRAVALARRFAGGGRVGLPISGTVLAENCLRDWPFAGRVGPQADPQAEAENRMGNAGAAPVYFGFAAAGARAVSVVGSFNGWQPDVTRLVESSAQPGWWHGVAVLPPGQHTYRFWAVDGASGRSGWHPDPENPGRQEGGFLQTHSFLEIG